jgi:predicted metal-dependent peptidase
MTDKLQAERILKARAELIASRVFYGTLVANVMPKPTRAVPTMATDGKTHFYNPEFVATLTQKQLLGVQAHETEHDARHHSSRRGFRDHQEWNICCDLAINGDLLSEGFELPEGRLFDPKYQGMSAEDIYRCRELDRAREQQQQQQSDDDANDADENESNDEQSNDDSDETNDDSEADESDTDADDNGNDQQGDDADESDDGNSDSDESDDDTANGDGDDNDANETDSASATGNGQAKADSDDSETDSGNAVSDTDADDSEPQSSGDPGMCGEVLDAADTQAEIAEQDSRWEVITRQAIALAKKAGDLPGYMTREIARMNEPKQDWREVFRAWIDQGATTIATWNRPNRRFIGQGMILPGTQRDGVNKVVFLIDTSGSMDDIALACVAREAQGALDDGAINEAIVVYGDTRVTRVDRYVSTDQIEFDPKGGGGTDMRPLFDWVAENEPDASLIVNFTDMEIGDPGPEPACPVLFAVTGYPQVVREYLKRTPWGAAGIDVGEH